MRFDLLVFIGRFQPVHNGHLAVIRQALIDAQHVLVLTGSADRPRTLRDPFVAAERAEMIRSCLGPADQARVTVAPLRDALYNDALWLRNVHREVFRCLGTAFTGRAEEGLRIGLVGHGKDRTSYYLKLFPTWGAVDVPNHAGVSATGLRELYFKNEVDGKAGEAAIRERVPAPVYRWLRQFREAAAYAELKAEQAFIDAYRAPYAALPYPPTFTCADAVVLQAGHLLVVRRKACPGRGLLALPGGFINGDEPALDAALRELREETGLAMPEATLRGALTAKDFFDEPFRSARGRTFSFAFRFDLPAETELMPLQPGDDAEAAMWLPLAKLRPQDLFDDHYFIAQKLVGF